MVRKIMATYSCRKTGMSVAGLDNCNGWTGIQQELRVLTGWVWVEKLFGTDHSKNQIGRSWKNRGQWGLVTHCPASCSIFRSSFFLSAKQPITNPQTNVKKQQKTLTRKSGQAMVVKSLQNTVLKQKPGEIKGPKERVGWGGMEWRKVGRKWPALHTCKLQQEQDLVEPQHLQFFHPLNLAA